MASMRLSAQHFLGCTSQVNDINLPLSQLVPDTLPIGSFWLTSVIAVTVAQVVELRGKSIVKQPGSSAVTVR